MSTTLYVGSLKPISGSVKNGRQTFIVDEGFDLVCKCENTTIYLVGPSGIETDLNSVPRLFNRIAPSQNYPASAVLHDQQCVAKEVPSYIAAAMYFWTLRMEGCSWLGAFARWFAVRYFGPQFKGEPYGIEYTPEE